MDGTATLPALRQELSIHRDDFTQSWLIHDPIRGKFHRIGEKAVQILSAWTAEAPEKFLRRVQTERPELRLDETALQELTEFLLKNKLATPEMGANADRLANEEASQRKPYHEQLIHKYLFFRIPLFQPKKFLDSWGPMVSRFFHPVTAWIIGTIGVLGLIFAIRQWDEFVTTFMYFFTLQGFIFYALCLIIIKALHELGHAFAARHYGVQVPVIGVAFLVMFPILYTDTTDAWRIGDRRARLLISSAGIITELSIAAISIFLWAFLPDGPFRSVAFFAATTSWVMSLFVNLNPWMRFDGYYIISDLVGTENLQERGFTVGRNVMRRILFGLEPKSEEDHSRKSIFGFTAYAWTTWIYRFFLFIGIAILVHHIFPKAIGIVLFIIEIGIFIALPIWRELKYWWSQKMSIIKTKRSRITFGVLAVMAAIFFLPWQTRIAAPALIRPADQTDIYPISAAEIIELRVKNGDAVQKGDTLVVLRAPQLEHKLRVAKLELDLAQAQWDRHAASTEDRQLRDIWRDRLSEKEESFDAARREIERLFIRAAQDGIISDIPRGLQPGRFVKRTDHLFRLITPGEFELIALPKDIEAKRLSSGAAFKFISDQGTTQPVKGCITHIAPIAEQDVEEHTLTTQGGGPIVVAENDQGEYVADIPVLRVTGDAADIESLRMDRGVVFIKAKPSSPASAVFKNVAKILLMETDF